MEKLIEFYHEILAFADLKADKEGHVVDSENTPVVVNGGQMLVLPTRYQLTNLSVDKEVFHPLSEDTTAKITKGLTTYIYRLNGYLNTVFAMTLMELKNIVCSPALSKEMANYPARLAILKNIEGKFSEKLDSAKEEKFLKFIASRLSEDPSKAFFNFQPSRGGSYKGERMARTGYVSFEFYRALKEDLELPRSKSAFQGFTKDDLNLIIQIYEAIFPGLDKPEAYNYGFSTGPYPFFTTVLMTGLKLAQPLNDVIETFEGAFSEGVINPISLKWFKTFEDKELLGRLKYMVSNLDQPNVDTQKEGPVEIQKPANVKTSESVPRVAEEVKKGRERVSMDEWLSKKAVPSPMGAQASQMELMKIHNEGYPIWYARVSQANNGIPPYGFPHPSQIPPGQPAPPYPGSPLSPPPQQQAQVGWGQTQPVDAWGRPIPQQQAQVGWGQPQPVDAWGRPIPQQQTAWGSPQTGGWGQQSNFNGTVIPGLR